MTDEETRKKLAKSLRAQLRKRDFTDAMKSSYSTIPNDTQFYDLLSRLDDAEKKKRDE